MKNMKSTGIVRTFAILLPAGATLLAMPALAAIRAPEHAAPSLIGSKLTTSSSLRALDSSTSTGTPAEQIKLAGKLSSAVRGTAIGSRAARGSNKADDQNNAATEPASETDTEEGQSPTDGETTPSGPFKVMIPNQSEPAAAAAPVYQPAKSTATSPATPAGASASGPVRTIVDRTNQNAEAPATTSPAAAQRQTATPAIKEAPDSGCIAGCYAPTSTQLTPPSGRRAAGATQNARTALPAQNGVTQDGIECLAGCDGISGRQLPRATSGAAEPATAETSDSSSQSSSNRVVIMRGNTRTKSYGISQ
jgi:hypothetical protein